MAIDTRFDLLSLLARRRETLAEWIVRTHVRSHAELLAQLEKLGALPISKSVYDAAKPRKERPAKAVKNIAEMPSEVSSQNSTEKQEPVKTARKRVRRSSEGNPPPEQD